MNSSVIKITGGSGESEPAVQMLYETSFPLHERRNWDQQMLLCSNGGLKLYVIESENQFIGFVFFWQLSNFVFVEHFATTPEWRGKGIGSFAVNWLIEKFTRIVLEVEPSQTSAEAARRMQFYERLGFSRFDGAYAQPPYHADGEYIPMSLLHINLEADKLSFEKVKAEIYRIVYGQLS
ncbi:MAG: GNAT family N-acetyltransferase [Agriterribacter sp.]